MTAAETVQNGIGFDADSNQYLTFTLGDEEYGVDILKVQEIKGYSVTTRVPRSPEFVKGVLNLRGTIVPVIDLRMRFGLDQREYDQFTVIIVVVVQGRAMGLIVDAVSDVLNLAQSEIIEVPEFSNRIDTKFISGMGRAGEKLIILLDVEKLLSMDEFHAVEAAQA